MTEHTEEELDKRIEQECNEMGSHVVTKAIDSALDFCSEIKIPARFKKYISFEGQE